MPKQAGGWADKQARKAEFAAEKQLQASGMGVDDAANVAMDARDAAMGKGEEELFEKKLSKEEKKALAKAKRDAKKKAKGGADDTKSNGSNGASEEVKEASPSAGILVDSTLTSKDRKREAMLDDLSKKDIIVTYESKRGGMHANSKDINVNGVTVTFHGKPLIEETSITINYGNRYGFLGPNGSGKSTVMQAIAARAIPIPDAIDIYFLDKEYDATDKTAIAAVFEVNEEVNELEQRAEMLNNAMGESGEDEAKQNEIQSQLEMVYDKLDAMDVNTAESRASEILFGLGFTTNMQQQKTREFSGGWRMRIALARALFLKPEFLLLDEPYVWLFDWCCVVDA
jgi:ATP-binding cassette subfamily F protein 2